MATPEVVMGSSLLTLFLMLGIPAGALAILIAHIMFGNRDKEPKPRFKAPAGWYATGKVGPSGAMLYDGPGSGDAAGIFDSFTPVQVVDKQGGYARVVAATGQGGWIDLRTLSEGA